MYFTQNIFTPDGADMIYLSSVGIHVVHLATMESKLLYQGHVTDVVMGTRTRRVFFRESTEGKLSVVDIDTGIVRKLGRAPYNSFITSVNSDETRLFGMYIEGNFPDYTDYHIAAMKDDTKAMRDSLEESHRTRQPALVLPLSHSTAVATEKYFASHTPEALFTLDIATGETKVVLNGNDWLAHPQFSPSDPKLILYAHEGPPDKVDRIWTVRTDDGSKPRMVMLRAGKGTVSHEFWSQDGKTIWFDRQLDEGGDFKLTGLDLATGAITAFNPGAGEGLRHYNISKDGEIFCGDGRIATDEKVGASAQTAPSRAWIELLRPNADGTMHSMRLASPTKHDYSKLEPNPHITPDDKYVIFTSNILGAEYVFAVEIAKQPTQAAAAEGR